MKRQHNEIEAFRAQELLLQRATEGLSEAQVAELAALGAEDDYSYDLAATAVDLATVPQYELPSEIAQRVLLAAGARPPRTATAQSQRRTTRTGAAMEEPGMPGTMMGMTGMTGAMPGATGPAGMVGTTGMTGAMTAQRLPTQQPVELEARPRGATQPPLAGNLAPGAGAPATLLGHLPGVQVSGPVGGPPIGPIGHAGHVGGPHVGYVVPIAAFPHGGPGPSGYPAPPAGHGPPVLPLAPRRSRAPMIVAWTAAVAGLAAAAGAIVWATRQEPQAVVQRIEVPTPAPATPPPPLPSVARAQLLATAGDVVTLPWTATTDPAGQGASGDVVWSPSQQEGYLRFVGLAANDPKLIQYQLWIFDKLRDESFPVDGGVFDVGPSGEVVIKISPKLRVAEPMLFAVTIEQPGGVVVSKRERVVVTAAAKTG